MRTIDSIQRPWMPVALVIGMGAAAGTTAPRLLPATERDAGRPAGTAQDVPAAAPVPGVVSDKLRPVLSLIAESLSLGPEAQRTEAGRSIEVLTRFLAKKGTHPEVAAALAALHLRLQGPAAAFAGAESEKIQTLSQLTQPIEGLTDGSEVGEARKQLLAFLRAEASDERLLQRLRYQAAATFVDVDFVVASIGDYVDSNVGWYADWQLEAIQAAMATADFTFDRVYLPEWPRERAATAHLHRESPGAIVFRGRKENGRTPLRVVLLVPETPTAGLHREALQNALTLARTWNLRDDTTPLRFLGPTFSGSIDSLRRALREDPDIWLRRRVQIVSGTATAASNRHVLEECSNGLISFSATTQPFGEWLRALHSFLGQTIPDWSSGRGMVVLHESNTTFGSTSVERDSGLLKIFTNASTIAFPLHISRLRDAAAEAAGPSARGGLLPRHVIPLTTRDARTPTDLLPALTPDLTAASVHTTMASVFDSLRRERFRVVVIIATDERDKLYLAREIRRAAPDTQLVIFGSHMLLLHPEYASYTRGALVVSSYSLAGDTGALTGGARRPAADRRFFQNWSAEGIYNAALVLMNRPELMDYDVPLVPGRTGPTGTATPAFGPPVWISTVGRTGFVPLAAYPARSTDSFLHQHVPTAMVGAAVVAPTTVPGERPPWRVAPLPALLLAGIFVAAVIWHGYVVVRQLWGFFRKPQLVRKAAEVTCRKAWLNVRHRTVPEDLRAGVDKTFNETSRDRDDWITQLQQERVTGYRRVFVLPWRPNDVRRTAALCVHAVFAVLGLAAAWWALLATRALGSTSDRWAIAAGLAVVAIPMLLAITGYTGPSEARPKDAHKQGLAFAGALALALVAAVPVLTVPLGRSLDTTSLPMPLMEAKRGLSLMSLVSPTVPIACFALCLYMWLVWQLRVLSFVGGGYTRLFGPLPTEASILAARQRPMAVGQAAAAPGQAPVAAAMALGATAALGGAAVPPAMAPPMALAVPPSDSPSASTAGLVGRVPRAPVSMMSVLLSGELTSPSVTESSALPRWRLGFTRVFDTTLPAPGRWKPLLFTLLMLAIVAPVVWLRVYTLEGERFTIVFRAATLGGLALATLTLAQTWGQWRQIGGALTRLGRSPLASAFSKVRAFHMDWRLNLRLPRRDELALLMAETDALESILDFRQPPAAADVAPASERALRERVARDLLASASLTAETNSLVDALEQERHSDHLRLMNCDTFRAVWQRTQRYLPLLHRWYEKQGAVPDKVASTASSGPTGFEFVATNWFERAEGAVALAQAFVIRDLLSRIVAGLSASCLCFVLLLGAHLLYAFPGRSTMLVIDWLAVGLSGAIAVIILVGMERSVVLSHLWGSHPGRISFNREFLQRLALYGALPVLTLISALFPEMGDTLFSWLAPARQLAGF